MGQAYTCPYFSKWGVLMRKFLFVFLVFTIIFLLSVSVYAGVGMTVKLPPPPSDVLRDKTFVISYKPKLGTYMLGSTDYDPGNIYVSSDGILVNSLGKRIIFRAKYRLVNGSWVHSEGGTGWSMWYDDVGSVDEELGNVVVFSTNNFYGTRNQLLFSSPSDSVLHNVLRNGLTFISTNKPTDISFLKILMYMYYPFRQILPYVVIFIVSIFSFYKFWGWLRGQVQGI